MRTAFSTQASSLEIVNSGDKQKEMPTPPAAKAKSMAQIPVVSSSEAGNNTARAQVEVGALPSTHRNVRFACATTVSIKKSGSDVLQIQNDS